MMEGSTIRERFFKHHAPPPVARINHGSYGAAPSVVLEEQERLRRLWLRQPDEFVHDHGKGAVEVGDSHAAGSDGQLESRIKAATDLVADFTNARAAGGEFCLVENATTAAAAIALHTLWRFMDGRAQPGDCVLMLDCAYGAVRKTFEHYVVGAGGRILDVKLPFPVRHEDEIVDAFRVALDQVVGVRLLNPGLESTTQTPPSPAAAECYTESPGTTHPQSQRCGANDREDGEVVAAAEVSERSGGSAGGVASSSAGGLKRPTAHLLVLDHVTSMPSVVLPVARLVALAKERGVPVFLDAAHALGNVEVDLEALGADFFTSNLHKWMLCPPAAALLHVAPGVSPRLHHPVTSHNFGQGLARECAWVGTRDYSALLAIPAAFKFAEELGGWDLIRRHNHEGLLRAANMLASSWGTSLGAPPAQCSSMAMVALPNGLGVQSPEKAVALRNTLRRRFQVEVPIYFNALSCKVERMGQEDGEQQQEHFEAYARISHQVYNVEQDYVGLRDAIFALQKEGGLAR